MAAIAPAAARTSLHLVVGDPATLTEPRWSVVRDSPVVTSLAFLPWELHTAPQRTTVARSSLVGAIILATRRPSDVDLATMRGYSFLSTEFSIVEASAILFELDTVDAFNDVFRQGQDWVNALPDILARHPSPGNLCLRKF